jgi:hypothetical protein
MRLPWWSISIFVSYVSTEVAPPASTVLVDNEASTPASQRLLPAMVICNRLFLAVQEMTSTDWNRQQSSLKAFKVGSTVVDLHHCSPAAAAAAAAAA